MSGLFARLVETSFQAWLALMVAGVAQLDEEVCGEQVVIEGVVVAEAIEVDQVLALLLRVALRVLRRSVHDQEES